ncbi:MAG: hypothetical protein EBY37_07140 [Flavobacteriia bacterium]|nr:hypothetical protein [Flavobacteriia bacterium]
MISPERKNIEEILGGTRIKYTVPNYQRAYNWGMTELQELMDNLILLLLYTYNNRLTMPFKKGQSGVTKQI